jgi:hypothetical protein
MLDEEDAPHRPSPRHLTPPTPHACIGETSISQCIVLGFGSAAEGRAGMHASS